MARQLFPPPLVALVRKEYREYRSHRAILLTAFGLPAFFMILPLVQLLAADPAASQRDIDVLLGQAMFTFFLTPVVVPAALAAYSVIGEKEQGTLDPMLSLPLSDRQFIHGKLIAIVAPSAGVACLVYSVFLVVGAIFFDPVHREQALAPIWALGIFGMAVPLALYSTLVGMTISARSRDLRVAEQLAALVILPTLAPIALITFQVVPLGLGTWAAFFATVAAIDAALLALAYRLFDRERLVAQAG